MPEYRDNRITLEGVRIVYKNFAGNETQYNAAGNRNFSVVLSDEQYEELLKDGWNVKRKPPREEGDGNFNTLPIKVHFNGRKPPRIVLISYRNGEAVGRTELGEDLAMIVDYADIDYCDITIRPFDWTVNGNKGRKAYLSMIYISLVENLLETKYADIPELDASGQPKALPPGQDPNIDDAEWYEGEE